MAQPRECPSAVATVKPGKETWAFEEAWDIAVEADPNGRVVETHFNGVFLVYADPVMLVRTLLRSTPAFIRRVVATTRCALVKEGGVGTVIDILRPYAGRCAFNAHLRGESRALERILETLSTVRKTGEYNCTLHIEGVGVYILVAEGSVRDCGFGCSLVIDSALEEAMHSL